MNRSTAVIMMCFLSYAGGVASGAALYIEQPPNYYAVISKEGSSYCYDNLWNRFNPCNENIKPMREQAARDACWTYEHLADCRVMPAKVPPYFNNANKE